MKRIFLLSLVLFTMSVNSFAQIRIEKRHYNRGWYISVGDHKMNSHAEKNSLNETQADAVVKAVNTESAQVKEEMQVVVLQTVPDSNKTAVAEPKTKIAEKPCIPKQVIHTAIKGVKTVAAFDVSKPAQSSNRIAKSERNVTKQTDPGESMWGYLFEMFCELLIFLGIAMLVVAIVLAILIGIGVL